jgi:predicted NAD/FAD-binding protein
VGQRSDPAASLTRREVLKRAAAAGALGAGASLLTRGASAADADQSPERVAIIGAGAGGVAAAYFLAGTFDVDLFEARAKIGGHADSLVVDDHGQPVTVDLGAQFFHPATHPIYVTLLEELGLYDPDHPAADATLKAPGSLCVFPAAGGAPYFSSTDPLAKPARAIEFAVATQLARVAVLANLPYEVTVDAWVRSLPLSRRFKDLILRPWITATIGAPRADAMRTSARSILQTFALSFPSNILQGASTYNSTIGLQGNLQRLLDLSPSVHVHTGTATEALTVDAAGWTLQTPAGPQGPYRAVLLNAPPRIGRELLRPLAAFADVTALLDRYEYFDSRLLIHTDPAYVQHARRNWTSYNAAVDGFECEGSVWLGALQPRHPDGSTVDVFKSWAQRRQADPAQIVAERRFKHPLITRDAIRAARALGPLQGRDGLYFSGQYTTGVDLQETAVYSAMKVAEALAPASQTLASLKARLALRGRGGISYDL